MSENSWQENDSYKGLELAEAMALPTEADDWAWLDRGFGGRRRKAALILIAVWGTTIALHLWSWGPQMVWALTGLLAIHLVRASRATPIVVLPDSQLLSGSRENWPLVSLLVAAKNEEAVIGELVRNLCALDYPIDRYEVWVIDDNSDDSTSVVLSDLTQHYQNLKVLRRQAQAGGGKSGALNQVLPMTRGEFLVVFDADAKIQPDFLIRSLPVFQADRVGAVQLRKAIIQADNNGPDRHNFWIRGQRAEMLLDAFMQQQRASIGGLGELRGNGQLVRRSALDDCGGWNEETVTDDLDLTFRLNLNHWDIQCLTLPPVYEEGVTTMKSLWHQRNRWAEGGYQRYLDYGSLIFGNRMGTAKTLDLIVFWIILYAMPMASFPDFFMAIVQRQFLIMTPLNIVAFSFLVLSTARGIRRSAQVSGQSGQGWLTPMLEGAQGLLYMLHWFVVMSYVTVKMAILPKRLKWVKTVHTGG